MLAGAAQRIACVGAARNAARDRDAPMSSAMAHSFSLDHARRPVLRIGFEGQYQGAEQEGAVDTNRRIQLLVNPQSLGRVVACGEVTRHERRGAPPGGMAGLLPPRPLAPRPVQIVNPSPPPTPAPARTPPGSAAGASRSSWRGLASRPQVDGSERLGSRIASEGGRG